MDVIKQIKKSSRCDRIINKILKRCSAVMENAETNAFKRLIEENTFPKNLKIARVAKTFKNSDRKNSEKYRLFSILSSLSIVFEELKTNLMVKFLDKKENIKNNQYGFRLIR